MAKANNGLVKYNKEVKSLREKSGTKKVKRKVMTFVEKEVEVPRMSLKTAQAEISRQFRAAKEIKAKMNKK